MNIREQFSLHANHYNSYNIIQQIVAKALIRDITSNPKKILEIGCGNGQVYKNISWYVSDYHAIDFSKNMCSGHPRKSNISVNCFDFDSIEFYNHVKRFNYDMIISSSSMQWSKNLPKLLSRLRNLSKEINVVLFTSNTFKSIHKIINYSSPILSKDYIEFSFTKYYDCIFETINYNLEFKDKKSMFSYIKNSGVSGERYSSYKEAKSIYKNYNLNYLEFEVIFIKAFSKSYN